MNVLLYKELSQLNPNTRLDALIKSPINNLKIIAFKYIHNETEEEHF